MTLAREARVELAEALGSSWDPSDRTLSVTERTHARAIRAACPRCPGTRRTAPTGARTGPRCPRMSVSRRDPASRKSSTMGSCNGWRSLPTCEVPTIRNGSRSSNSGMAFANRRRSCCRCAPSGRFISKIGSRPAIESYWSAHRHRERDRLVRRHAFTIAEENRVRLDVRAYQRSNGCVAGVHMKRRPLHGLRSSARRSSMVGRS